MKTSRAGSAEANIIQMGKWLYRPSGWMTQPRAEALDTLRPSGTESFCGGGAGKREQAVGGAWLRPGDPDAEHFLCSPSLCQVLFASISFPALQLRSPERSCSSLVAEL